jgi:hypothetical protein
MKGFSFILFCALVMQPQLWAAQSGTAVAGKIVFSSGNNTAVSANGEQRVIKQGDAVRAGDKLQTGNGQLQVRFTDNGFASLKPKSQLTITEYNFNGKEDGSEKAVFSLLKGSVRAVTGFIGKHNKNAYKYETPVATIGIRGTAFVLNFCNQDCFGTDGSLLEDGLYVNNGEGRVYVENNEGVIDLVRGQFAYVEDVNSEPEQITQPPAMGEMFREETEDYEFERRGGEALVEAIITDNSIIDGGLGELRSMAYTLLGEELGSDHHDFLLGNSAENTIRVDENGAVIRFDFFDELSGHVLRFDSRNARLIEERSGSNTIVDASWGIWEGGFRYTDETLSTVLENLPQHMAYMGFSNPTDFNRLPIGAGAGGGTATYNVQLGSNANGAVNTAGALSINDSFIANIGVNWELGMFTDFDLEARFTDGSRFDLALPSMQTISPAGGGVALTGSYNGAFASGNANYQFANDAQVIGGTFHVMTDPSPVAVGTFLLGQEGGIFEDAPVITQ